ncbi:thiol reductant ABC exporter subunit CydD [Jeotgalibacillus proteolyticus]|uniref:Thiol reductant ABC exporter subunit CydD n=1 Tax=Jeotgalibacillus proteolyticus TaxID=2082395 RepID=A0A2S5GCZ5_9BACL|nr:thiol reductant ABC exporter subunit CydD [Jeotgalibacillus proteolyticus]PPA70773.1 thiol reductant ABC exporter subunit CydD [Jeotgalibacillus proteolyticus]
MNELNRYAKQYKGTQLFLVLTAILTGLAILAQAYLIVIVVDRIFLQGQAFSEIVPLLGWLALALVARAGLTYASGRAGVRMAAKVKSQFRRKLLAKFAKNPIQASLQGQSGQKVSVMLDAVDEIDSYFSKYIPQVIQTSVIPLMLLIAAFSQHITTGLLMLITAPFIPLFFIIIGIKTQKKSEQQMDKMAAFSGKFLDTLQGLTTLKLFGRSAKQKESIRESSLGFRDATLDVLKVAFVSSLMLEYISMLGIGLIALELGLRLVVFESVTFFTAFFLLVIAPEFYLAIKELGSAFHTGRGSMGAAKKIIDELEENEQTVKWGSNELVVSSPPAISLDNAGFKYGEQGFELKEITTHIKPYTQAAIVGRSGSGKSTILNLLSGLVSPQTGQVLVEGQPLSEWTEDSWFRQVSYISQRPYVFAGSITENIAIGGNQEATREEIEEAAKKAGIWDLAMSLDQGFDTQVGEGGRGLSGGEKQRLAIARAFLKKPSIILFDEPTTGLDLKTEQILQQSIKELSAQATVITVAHRLHTIKHAELILFLKDGRLEAAGTHDQLVKAASEYRDMVTVQQGGETG